MKLLKLSSDYWFGYVYTVFTGYLAFSSLTHFVCAIQSPNLFSAVAYEKSGAWTGLILSGALSGFFCFACSEIARESRKVLKVVYWVVGLHALNVFFRGVIVKELILWLVLSGYAIRFFRKREAALVDARYPEEQSQSQ